MNGSHATSILVLIFASQSGGYTLRSETVDYENVSLNYDSRARNEVTSSIFKTAKQYYCHFSGIDNPEMIIYGAKSWVFPRQNVNLTLSYPPAGRNNNDTWYLITGFNVILFMDNTSSKGFITSGGILEDSISLTFTSDNASMLSYEFCLFGLRSDSPLLRDVLFNHKITPMC